MKTRSDASTLDFMEVMVEKEVKLEHAHPWENSDGSPGGMVADTATVDPTAIIDRDAFVMPGAVVGPGVWVRSGFYVQAGQSTPTLRLFSDP